MATPMVDTNKNNALKSLTDFGAKIPDFSKPFKIGLGGAQQPSIKAPGATTPTTTQPTTPVAPSVKPQLKQIEPGKFWQAVAKGQERGVPRQSIVAGLKNRGYDMSAIDKDETPERSFGDKVLE